MILVATTAIFTTAQEPWLVKEQCIGDLTYPLVSKGHWDFPGVIISTVDIDGIRAARGDQNVDYWLAMAAPDSYPFSGSLSPDGFYFAFPVGHMDYDVNTIGSELASIDYVRIVRTDGITDEVYRFPASGQDFVSMDIIPPGFAPVLWLGTDRVYYQNQQLASGANIYDLMQDIYPAQWPYQSYPGAFLSFSPNLMRAFQFDESLGQYDEISSYRLYDFETGQQLDAMLPQNIVWLHDSSAYVASDETGLSLLDDDGNLLEAISVDKALSIAVSPDDGRIAYRNQDNKLFLADLEEKVVYDMCFSFSENTESFPATVQNLAWSPDGFNLAFSYDGYLVILDMRTLVNQVIDTRSSRVIGWVPLEGDTIETVSSDFYWPTATLTPTPTPTFTPTPRPTMTLVPTATLMPTPTIDPTLLSCQLNVLTGVNLRAGAGSDTEKVGSAAEGFQLIATAQQFNAAEGFTYWQLNTGEWIREDFVREDDLCQALPQVDVEAAGQ